MTKDKTKKMIRIVFWANFVIWIVFCIPIVVIGAGMWGLSTPGEVLEDLYLGFLEGYFLPWWVISPLLLLPFYLWARRKSAEDSRDE